MAWAARFLRRHLLSCVVISLPGMTSRQPLGKVGRVSCPHWAGGETEAKRGELACPAWRGVTVSTGLRDAEVELEVPEG